MDKTCDGQLATRYNHAYMGLAVGGGVIDADYRGEVGVILYNHGDEPFNIDKGDRIAQLLIIKIQTPAVVKAPLSDTAATRMRAHA